MRATGPLSAGTDSIQVRATDGARPDSASVDVVVRGGGPTVDFARPPNGTTIRHFTGATISWTENDPGPSPAQRQVRRQQADPVTPGSCGGVDWQNDGPLLDAASVDPAGSVGHGWSFKDSSLVPDGCYRWFVRLTNNDGSSAAWASSALLVDTHDPPPPVVTGTGKHVYQSSSTATIWVRGGHSGTLHLTAHGTDPTSGVLSHQFGALSHSTGWTVLSAPASGDPAGIDLHWSSNAVNTTVAVRSTDRAGHIGPTRTVVIRVDARRPGAPTWKYPILGVTTSDDTPDLHWADGTDSGSGFARLQGVQRLRGAIVHGGSCSGVTYTRDGPARLLDRHHEEIDVVSGYCYRWVLTPLDNVGNTGHPVTSGTVLIDRTPPTANFLAPDEGTLTAQSASTLTVRWTQAESGGSGGIIDRSLERERGKVVNAGSCDGVTWRVDGPTDHGSSPSPQSGLQPGYCYRWRINLEDRAANVGSYLSGRVLIQVIGQQWPPPGFPAHRRGMGRGRPGCVVLSAPVRSGRRIRAGRARRPVEAVNNRGTDASADFVASGASHGSTPFCHVRVKCASRRSFCHVESGR